LGWGPVLGVAIPGPARTMPTGWPCLRCQADVSGHLSGWPADPWGGVDGGAVGGYGADPWGGGGGRWRTPEPMWGAAFPHPYPRLIPVMDSFAFRRNAPGIIFTQGQAGQARAGALCRREQGYIACASRVILPARAGSAGASREDLREHRKQGHARAGRLALSFSWSHKGFQRDLGLGNSFD
jgi:hypothetical protein